jgi:uncharacterized membrane protein
MQLFDGVDPAGAWLAAFLGSVALVVAAAVAFPQRVYDGFLWRYFWGPVDADAHGATCAVRAGGTTERLYSNAACAAAEGITATPGYTTVSTASYAIVLIFMLVGVWLLLQRLDIRMTPRFYVALFPYILLGGALRVVEDVNVAFLDAGAETLIPYPPVALIISPFIYFVMFAFTLATLVAVIVLSRRGVIGEHEPYLAGVGGIAVTATVGWLLYVSATARIVGFFPAVLAITLGGATLIAGIFWWASERHVPVINEGTGYIGAIIVWGHSVDGIANVVSLDWTGALGIGVTYGSKHVVNAATVRIAERLQPSWLSEAIGTAWPFLGLKIAAAVFVVWVFNDDIFEDSPRYAYLLLIAVLAVGLGPGTRDMLRATLAI